MRTSELVADCGRNAGRQAALRPTREESSVSQERRSDEAAHQRRRPLERSRLVSVPIRPLPARLGPARASAAAEASAAAAAAGLRTRLVDGEGAAAERV